MADIYDPKVYVSIDIPMDSPLYFMLKMKDSRRGFIITLLEDLHSLYGNMDDYLTLTKEERERKYLGKDASREDNGESKDALGAPKDALGAPAEDIPNPVIREDFDLCSFCKSVRELCKKKE